MLFASESAGLTSGWFLENAWLIPVIPAAAFFAIMFFGKRLPRGGSELGIGSIAISLVLAIGTTFQWIMRVNSASAEESHSAFGLAHSFIGTGFPAAEGHSAPYVEPVIRSWTWWQSGSVKFTIGEHIDGVAVMLLLVVTFISLLVQIYSTEYVKGDRRYTQFFGALTLFSAGMLVMVLAESMVQFILGWELMGLCSFMLIGHWWEDKANSRAALKAFFTVRTGDIGLLVGTGIIFFAADGWAQAHGSNGFSIQAINGWAASNPQASSWMTLGAIALFIAAIGKSGQFPLHTWLPDAMAGPTPVSSLLHSSTMVVAGVYLVARLYPVFFVGLDIMDTGVNLIAVIAAITIIMAAALAFVQTDIKKVLAYSTVSQLGYMMLGLGVGAWLPAVFHIFTHAFFKCALFLCAGSISHSGSHHSFDMKRDMGGLRKHMPITFWVWIVSTLALCGVPVFSGFWSKDEIIDNANFNGYRVFYIVGLVGAAMTAGYMARATYLTFFGEARGAAAGEHHDDAHSPDLDHALGGVHGSDVAAPIAGDIEPGHIDVYEEVGADREPVLVGSAHATSDVSTGDVSAGVHGVDRVNDDHEVVHDDHYGGDHHDDHGGHHGPHESPWRITVPLVILGFLAVVSGFLNAPGAPFKTHLFQEWVEPSGVAVPLAAGEGGDEPHGFGEIRGSFGSARAVFPSATPSAAEGEGEEGPARTGCGYDPVPDGEICQWPAISHAEFAWKNTIPSIVLVLLGGSISWWMCLGLYTDRRNPFKGLTSRFAPARYGLAFLVDKYFLDYLYEGVIVRFVAHPAANAFYWVNQNVLDRVVNTVGSTAKVTGRLVYRDIDQRVVDGAVNLSGAAAEEGGKGLQPMQSGRVSQYGALLFGAVTVFGIVLVILNV